MNGSLTVLKYILNRSRRRLLIANDFVVAYPENSIILLPDKYSCVDFGSACLKGFQIQSLDIQLGTTKTAGLPFYEVK